MTRTEKANAIAALQQGFSATSLAVTTEYRGLTVAELNALRRQLKGVNARYQVAKNTLTRRALKETAFARLDELLTGPVGLVFAGDDPVAVAKILVKFAEQHDKLKITGAVLEGERLEAKAVGDLAKLPSREALLAQLLSLMQAPATQLLRTIQEPGARLVRLLGAVERAKESG